MKNLLLLTVIAVASLQVASLAKAADHEDKDVHTGAAVHHFSSDTASSDREPQTYNADGKAVATEESNMHSVDTPTHGPSGRMNWTR